MRYIGDLYRDGQGAPQDYAKAREWFEKAAAAGDASASKALSDLQWAPKRNEIEAARSSGQYADALRLQEELAQEIEADEAKTDGKPGARTASELDSLSWHALFAREFPRALSAAERAHSLAPDALWIEINRAHALMFFGRAAEARALYLSHRDEPVPNNADKPWQRVIVEDFAEFRKVGLVNPQMAEIEAALAAGRGTSLSK